MPRKKKPRKPKEKYSTTDYIVWIALAILVFWIVKTWLRLDPPYEDFISTIPWIAVAFGAGALYAQVHFNKENIEEIKTDLKSVRDSVNQIKGELGLKS